MINKSDIEKLAYEIWEGRIRRGWSGTAVEDYLMAERVLRDIELAHSGEVGE